MTPPQPPLPFQLEGNGAATFEDSWYECPVCGGNASIVDATYSRGIAGQINTELRLTPSQLWRLRQVSMWVKQELERDEPDTERAARVLEKTIEENAPQVKPWLEAFRGQTSMAVGTWVMVLLGILTLLLQFDANRGIDAEQLEQILDETVRRVQEADTVEAPSEPPPPVVQDPGDEPAMPGPASGQ